MPMARANVVSFSLKLSREILVTLTFLGRERGDPRNRVVKDAILWQLSHPNTEAISMARSRGKNGERAEYITVELPPGLWDRMRSAAGLANEERPARLGPWIRKAIERYLSAFATSE